MQKIKVAHILHSVGGVDVSLRLILENSDANVIEHFVIHGNADTSKSYVNKNGERINNFRLPIYREISPLNDLKSIFKAYKILKKIKPDIIHCHSAKGGVIGRILGKILNIKTYYTPQAFSYLSAEKKWLRNMYLMIEKLLIFDNNYILASSNSEKNRAIKEVGYKESKVLVFNNSINEIVLTKELSIPKTWTDEYLCTVGRPSFQKNIELMIRVMHSLKETKKMHLVVMGVGHHVGKLKEVKDLIEVLDMKNDVTLLDWTDRNDIFHIINNSKLYISTARYEGLPYSLLESIALSKPCVVSNCDGNRDVIINGVNGFVINSENPLDYKNAILELLKNNDLYNEMSINANKIFCESFDISKNINNLEKIYKTY